LKFSVPVAELPYEDLPTRFDDMRFDDAGVIAQDGRRLAMGNRRYHL
jgi:hypothetical protein